jgi:hypothetical protein
MKILINRNGDLLLDKNGTGLKDQYCRHGSGEDNKCSDNCPLFGELLFVETSTLLPLCRATLTVNSADMVDLRTKKTNTGVYEQ